MSAIALDPSLPQPVALGAAPSRGMSSRKAQLAVIITGLAAAAILSATGVLSAAVLTTMGIATASTAVRATYVHFFGKHTQKTGSSGNTYSQSLSINGPFKNCVATPIEEEVLFRGLLQGGLHAALKYALPVVSYAVLGMQVPLATILAIGVASVIFGAAHLSNDHDGKWTQALTATVGGAVYGALFQGYGIWAAILAHIINNTIVITITGT